MKSTQVNYGRKRFLKQPKDNALAMFLPVLLGIKNVAYITVNNKKSGQSSRDSIGSITWEISVNVQ